jgi:3-hydroxyacyl-CoA dehydrogenase/enoyl-CoA hydratase/3-hydroxybutyryl-CoA epimerase
MESRIMNVLGDRVLELGPKPDDGGPYRHFRLTRDGDGIAWLLFDRAEASANTLSADVIEELDLVLTASFAPQKNPASSRAPTSTNFAVRPTRAPSRPRSPGRMP